MAAPRFPTASLQGLSWLGIQPPPASAVAAVKTALASTAGVWHLSDHQIGETSALISASKAFFDQPAARKWSCVVPPMDRSRGWEMYPQHLRFHRGVMASRGHAAEPGRSHAEPSAAEGILCERFVCGPPVVCNDDAAAPFAAHPFYSSRWARVFYERNRWPTGRDATESNLRAEMELVYPKLERVALASAQLLAAALGVPHTAFDKLITTASASHPEAPLRHHSRLQINNYPSQLRWGKRFNNRTSLPIRASRHFDTSLLTVLCRMPSVDNHELHAGSSGALEVYLSAERQWVCVPARPEEVTVFLGNLAGLLTGFALQGTTHRVTNPAEDAIERARRLSIGFNLKPDYGARAMPPPLVRAHLTGLPQVDSEKVPLIGLVGRVGWQNHAMQTRGLSRIEAVSSFKGWKNEMVGKLRSKDSYGAACVY